MLGDEIQYMGTRIGSGMRPFHPVTAVTLVVETCGDLPAHRLTFHRAQTSTISIGRRPACDDKRESTGATDQTAAQFRCRVISRKHAKIAFADTGHAYLIDLRSHHGTHVRKQNELVSTPLLPEVPYPLSDGDIITFGKTVGRDNMLVRPVTARIELLCEPQTPMRATTMLHFLPPTPQSENKSSPKSSGCYGLPADDSVSASSYSSSESDVEEIDPPSPRPETQQPSGSAHLSAGSQSSANNRYTDIFRRWLTNMHPSRHSHDLPHCPIPPISLPAPPQEPPIPYYSQCVSRSPSIEAFWQPLHSQSNPVRPPSAIDSHPAPNPPDIPSISHRENRDPLNGRSRESSPMDLSSPSPAVAQSGAVIHVWQPARASAPIVEEVASPVTGEGVSGGIATVPGVLAVPDDKHLSDEVNGLDDPSQPVKNGLANVTIPAAPAASELPPVTVPTSHALTPAAVENMQSALAALRADVSRLDHRQNARSQVQACVMANRCAELEDRVTELDGLYISLSDQADNAASVDVTDLQAQVDAMEDQIEAFAPLIRDCVDSALSVKVDAEDTVASLKSLYTEIKAYRQDAAAQLKAHLEAIDQARLDALAALKAEAQVQAQLQAQANQITTVPCLQPDPTSQPIVAVQTSLKRKRRIYDTGVESQPAAADDDTPAPPLIVEKKAEEVVVAAAPEASDPSTESPLATERTLGPLTGAPSPSKRRRILSSVVQTTSAIALGAVVTWSALAFS